MMTYDPSRVTAAEISELLSAGRALTPQSPLGEQLAYFERKAKLLSCIAAEADTDDAREVAAEAWDQVAALTAQLRQKAQEESDQP